jgi:cellulose synthase/poly-beta-1,6-N-acetylglucosamine synthase-like glycosyltransferase
LGAADAIIGIPGMFACYQTGAVREVGGFCPDINGEDSDVALRIGEAGYRLIIDADLPFTSEVPRSFAHLREERLRWYRSIYHVVARNRRLLLITTPSVRGHIVLPFLLMNSGRRAMGWPLLLFAINFLLLAPDPESSLRVSSLLAILMGAPLLNAIIAILVNLRPWGLLQLPAYIGFRMLRYYFTLEALLSMTYERFAGQRGDEPVQTEIALLHHDAPVSESEENKATAAAATATRIAKGSGGLYGAIVARSPAKPQLRPGV